MKVPVEMFIERFNTLEDIAYFAVFDEYSPKDRKNDLLADLYEIMREYDPEFEEWEDAQIRSLIANWNEAHPEQVAEMIDLIEALILEANEEERQALRFYRMSMMEYPYH